MPPRPARSAKKNISYKLDTLDDDTSNDKSKGKKKKYDDSDDDDVDSDEYVEPQKDKDDDDDDDLEMLEDEDEDMPEPNEDDSDDEDGAENSKPARKKRRQKIMNSFSVSLDQMNQFLDTNGVAQEAGDNLGNNGDLKIIPATLPRKAAPPAPTSRIRGPKKSKLSKKGDMRRGDNFPESWIRSHQAPSQNDIDNVSMTEEVLRNPVYTNIGSSIKDFRVITEPSDMDEYLPILTSAKIYARDSNIEMATMTSKFMPTTDRVGVNETYILNTGFSVWALDWCPLPSFSGKESGDNMNYIAVGGFPDTAENCLARDQLYPLGKQDAHPNIIQLWKVNCETESNGKLKGEPESYLTLCILHSYGAVLDLKWCPTGNYLPAGDGESDLARLGILAGSFTDGTIRFFSIPDPISLQRKLGLEAMNGTNPDTIYIQYQEPYATIRLGDVNFMSIAWGTASRLAAGVTNGTAAIWDISTLLNQSKETLAEKDSEFLDPVFLPQLHDVCVRSIDWLRSSDPTEIPWIIVTSGYDGHVRYTDLRDMYVQLGIKTILGVPMITRCVPWAEGAVYIDIDLSAKLDQLYLECRGFRLFNAKGTIWDISCSDYQPYIAAAISDGHVRMTNPSHKSTRGVGMSMNNIYQLQAATADEPGVLDSETIQSIGNAAQASTGSDGPSSSTQENPVESAPLSDEISIEKIQTYSFLEGEDREHLSKPDGFMRYYDPNIAIQKVQWSRSFHSAAWLASGSAGGIVRIDNTILQSDEKISNKSAPGKKDSAPKKKIGRPKKNNTVETTPRGKKKAANTTTDEGSGSIVAKFSAMTTTTTTVQEVEGDQEAATVGPSSAVGKRSTRQAVKLAPIFARALSSNSLNSSPVNSTAEDEEGQEENEDEDEYQEQDEDLGAASKAKPKTSTKPRKKPTPKKTKGNSNPQGSVEVNQPIDEDGDTRMLDEADNITVEAGVQIESSTEVTSSSSKGKSKATVPSSRGRQGKNKQKSTTSKDKETGGSIEGAVTGPSICEGNEGNIFAMTGVIETTIQGDQDGQVASTVSSRASSVAPSSPRKKRAPAKPKKKVEENDKRTRSLKDMWGASTTTPAKSVEDGNK